MASIANRFCSICLDTKPTDKFNVLPCLHWFCRGCLGQIVQNVCPLCRSPFGNEIDPSSVPINIESLSQSAPSTGARMPSVPPPAILSRSVGSSIEDFESLVTFTRLQNINSLSQVLTELEVRERSGRRKRRRRKQRRRSSPPAPPPLSTPPAPLFFQFDDDTTS